MKLHFRTIFSITIYNLVSRMPVLLAHARQHDKGKNHQLSKHCDDFRGWLMNRLCHGRLFWPHSQNAKVHWEVCWSFLYQTLDRVLVRWKYWAVVSSKPENVVEHNFTLCVLLLLKLDHWPYASESVLRGWCVWPMMSLALGNIQLIFPVKNFKGYLSRVWSMICGFLKSCLCFCFFVSFLVCM